jgi:nicotinamidase-related amidase
MKQALIVIDAQKELIEGTGEQGSVFQKESLLTNINTVINKALEAEAQIVIVRDVDVAEGKGEGFEVHPEIIIPPNSKIIDKKATNAFHGTPLLAALKENKIEHIVIMGCKTEYCIDTAVRAATVNGLDVTLVEDGHSTTDSPCLTAEQIIAHHNKVLHGHYNVEHFSMVRKSNEDLFEPEHHKYR